MKEDRKDGASVLVRAFEAKDGGGTPIARGVIHSLALRPTSDGPGQFRRERFQAGAFPGQKKFLSDGFGGKGSSKRINFSRQSCLNLLSAFRRASGFVFEVGFEFFGFAARNDEGRFDGASQILSAPGQDADRLGSAAVEVEEFGVVTSDV